MDILITRQLTLRPLLEVDADDILELIAHEPDLAAKLPRAMIALIGNDDLSASGNPNEILVVIREKLIGWVSLHEAESTAFAAGSDDLRAEALAAALQYRARLPRDTAKETQTQQQSSQFAA